MRISPPRRPHDPPAPDVARDPRPRRAGAPEPRPAPAGQRALLAHEKEIDALIAQMTLDEKVGQMTQPDQMFLAAPSDVATYHLGSLLSGGDSDPKARTRSPTGAR